MVKRLILCSAAVLILMAFQQADEISQWRGPQRNGIYPDKGLLKKWPEKGPRELWSFEGLGAGHGSVSFTKDKLFVLGMPDSTGILYAFDLSGKLLWKKAYGPEWNISYGGPRSTPTIVGNLVYFESGKGTVYCYDANSGELKWSVDLLTKFDAKNVEWGKAESVLIDGNKLICMPGGPKNNIVALDRLTGKTIWISPGNGEPAAYNSPILVKHNNTSLIVTLTSESIVGIDAETGQFYWQSPQIMEYKNNANTPVYSDGMIYLASDMEKPNSGLVALKLSDDGKKVNVEWRVQEFTSLMGGSLSGMVLFMARKLRKNHGIVSTQKPGKFNISPK
jgi:outer membrane protein assembly factor BamB